MAETKGWAIIRPEQGGRLVGIGISQYEAWKNAGQNDGFPPDQLEKHGYRCIRVTITEDTK